MHFVVTKDYFKSAPLTTVPCGNQFEVPPPPRPRARAGPGNPSGRTPTGREGRRPWPRWERSMWGHGTSLGASLGASLDASCGYGVIHQAAGCCVQLAAGLVSVSSGRLPHPGRTSGSPQRLFETGR